MIPDVENSGLYTDYYELTMAQGYYLQGRKDIQASFDYFFRKLPFNGGYVVFAGLSDLLDLLIEFKYSQAALEYLQAQGFKKEFLEYLRNFEFEGDIYSCQEGEIVFPYEPILRVEGSLIETQLVETIVLNILNFASLIATKASRMEWAAKGRQVIDFGLRRAQATGAILASKAAIIGGAAATSNVYSAFKYNLEATGTQAHSWIQSYDDELTAFRDFARLYPENCILLVDTYDTLQSGIPNAIKVAKELEEQGEKLLGIRLDSGNLTELSKKARQMLDENGLQYAKIAVSGQQDEYSIKEMLAQETPVDVFGVGTRLITGSEDAALDGVYKLVQVNGQPSIKISEDIKKMVLPGQKNILRCGDKNFNFDAIIDEKEDDIREIYHPYQDEKRKVDCRKKERLLQKVMEKGQKVIETKNAAEISRYRKKRLDRLPRQYKEIENVENYQVGVSKELKDKQQEIFTMIKQKITRKE